MTNTRRSTLALLAALLLAVPAAGQEKGGESDEPESPPRDGADSEARSVHEQLEDEPSIAEDQLENVLGHGVHFGDMEATGECEPPKETRVDRQASGGIRSCLDSSTDEDSQTEGSVELRWTVDSDGSVSSASVEDSEVDNAELEECIVDVFEGLSLPEREAGSCRISHTVDLEEKPEGRVTSSGDARKLKLGRSIEGMDAPDKNSSDSSPDPQISRTDDVRTDQCPTSDISEALDGKSNAVTYCYKKALELDSESSGTMQWDLEVGAEGELHSAELAEDTLDSEKATSCVRRVLKRMRFPKPDADRCEVRTTYEFSTN